MSRKIAFLIFFMLFCNYVFTADAVIAYKSESGNGYNYPKIRFWDSTGAGDWGPEIELNDSGYELTNIIVRYSPISSRIVIIAYSYEHYIDAYVCDNQCYLPSSWRFSNNIATVRSFSPSVYDRPFDLAFESKTGNALLVYAYESTNTSKDLAYQILYASNFSFTNQTEYYLNEAGYSTDIMFDWVAMDANPNWESREIVLVAHDKSSHITAWVWNGTAFTNEKEISRPGDNDYESMAVKYTPTSRVAMVLGAERRGFQINWTYWDGDEWLETSYFEVDSADGNAIEWISLKSYDNILQAVFVDDGSDLHTGYFDFDKRVWSITENIDTDIDLNTARPADFSFNRADAGNGYLIWDTDTNSDKISYMYCSPECVNSIETESSYARTGCWLTLYENPTSSDYAYFLGLRLYDDGSKPGIGSFIFSEDGFSNYGDTVITSNTGYPPPSSIPYQFYDLSYEKSETKHISQCQALNEPGEYVIYGNLTGYLNYSGVLACLYINSSNVLVNGDWKTIDGDDTASTYGIYANGKNNVTVKIINITDYYDGIHVSNMSNFTLYYVFSNSNTVYGFWIETSNFTNLTQVTANSNNMGIRLRYSLNSIISTATANQNVYGVYFDYSNHSTATNVQMHNNTNTGYVLESYSTNNTLRNSVSQNNSVRGILLTVSSPGNKFINVSLIKNIGRGGTIQSSSHNNLIENCTISHTTGTGYGLDLSTNSNNITGTVFFNNSARQLSLGGSSNKFYNNIFNATGSQSVIVISSGTHYWNTTKTLQTNIIGKTYIGGNWYSNYTGIDITGDYLGDTNYLINANNQDYYPLTENSSAIFNCTNITSSGTYYLGSNIIGQQQGTSKCIEIKVENVTLEMNGFTMNSGVPSNAYTGILINATEFKDMQNITVKNGYFQDYETSIMLDSLTNYLIKNISVNSSKYGIYAYSSKNGNFTSNNLSVCDNFGILLTQASNNNFVIQNNFDHYNDYPLYLARSHNNTLAGNNISMSDWNGISLVYSENNTIENNTVKESLYYGIWVSSSRNNIFRNNNLNYNYHGILIADSNNTVYSGGIISNSTRNGIIAFNSVNDTFANLVFQNSSWGSGSFLKGSMVFESSRNNRLYNLTMSNAGLYIDPSNNITVENVSVSNAIGNGLDLNQTTNSTFRNFYIINASNGVSIYTSSINNTLANFTVLNSRAYGVLVNSSSDDNELYNLTVFNSSTTQLFISSSAYNLIYNSIFNATGSQGVVGIYSPEQPNPKNYWNTTKASQTNILGKEYMGGNWYSDYNGADLDGDYLGDTPYYIGTGGNSDYYPLTYETNSISDCMNITRSGQYAVTRDLEKNQSSGNCIDIKVSNVSINLSGYSITGVSPVTTNTYAVYGTNLNNISIFSGAISKYYMGIYLSNVSNSTIYGLSVSSIGNSGSGIYIILSTQANISNCNSTGNDRYGFLLSSVNNSILSNNLANGNLWHGFYLISSSKINLTNNTATKNDLRGFYLDSVSNLSLVNNTASLNGREGFYFPSSGYENNLTNNTANGNGYSGIYLFGGSSNTINRNYIISNNVSGIYLMSSSNSNNVTFNIANNNTRHGIEIYSCSGNLIYENTAHDNNHGILMNSSSNNTLAGNTANYNSENGIYYYSASDNDLVNSTANYNSGTGILLWSDSHFSKIENATVLGNLIGLKLDQSNRNNVSIVYSSGNSDQGIFISRSSNNTLSNITSLSNPYGIGIERTYDINVSSSVFYGNSISQIYINDARRNLIYNSIFNATAGSVATLIDANSNYWNISKTLQTNIIGKPYIGGNWYSNYTGLDISGDYLGDTNYYVDADNMDYYPLTDSINKTILLCQNITSSGQYNVSANLSENQSSGACIHVLANNTEIDLQGNSITGKNQSSTYGIQIASNVINTTIKNGIIRHYSKNIFLTLNNNQTTMQDLTLQIANTANFYSIHIMNSSMDYLINRINSTASGTTNAEHVRVSGSRGTINNSRFRDGLYGAYYEGNSSNLASSIVNNTFFDRTPLQTSVTVSGSRMLIENSGFSASGSTAVNRFSGITATNCSINRTINYGGATSHYTVQNSVIVLSGSPGAYTGGSNVYFINNVFTGTNYVIAYVHSSFYFINNSFRLSDGFSTANTNSYSTSWIGLINNTFRNMTVSDGGRGSIITGNTFSNSSMYYRGNNTEISNNIIDCAYNKNNGLVIGSGSESSYLNTSNITIFNNSIKNCVSNSLYFYNIHNSRIYDNVFSNSTRFQATIFNASNLMIYNNIFNATNATQGVINYTHLGGLSNSWNISKTLQTNIIGGAYLGGNYYSNYSGWDKDGDYLGDTENYTMDASNIDYYPLTFNSDSIPPSISFAFPTPQNNSNLTANWININVTANETNLSNITIYIYNATNSLVNLTTCYSSPCYYNFTGMEYADYYINATASDLAGWSNSTETRNITLTQPIHSWHIFYGQVYSSNIALSSNTFFNWNNTLNGYVYATAEGSDVNFSALYALGKTKTNTTASNDFSELDSVLSISGAPDSVAVLYSSGGSTPLETQNLTFMRHYILDVPMANSSSTENATAFRTGILWDSSDDTNGEYDSIEKEDIVFITLIDNSKQGGYGNYDYEMRLPGNFDIYNSGTTITMWMELK